MAAVAAAPRFWLSDPRAQSGLLADARTMGTAGVSHGAEGVSVVARPEDPNLDARRKAIRTILMNDCRMSAAVAEGWIREWETEATARGLDPGFDYWTIGLTWIKEQLQARWQP